MKIKTKVNHFNEVVATKILGIASSIYFFYVCTVAIVAIRTVSGYSQDWLLDVANDLQLEFLALTLFAAARSEKWLRNKLNRIDTEVKSVVRGR